MAICILTWHSCQTQKNQCDLFWCQNVVSCLYCRVSSTTPLWWMELVQICVLFLWWWIGWKGKNCLINEYSFWLCQGKCGITMYRRQVHNTLKIADFFFLNRSWSLMFTLRFQGFWKMGLIVSPPVVGEFDFLFRFKKKNHKSLCRQFNNRTVTKRS